MSRRVELWVSLALSLAATGRPGWAEAQERELRALEANHNATSLRYGWLQGTRARMSAPIGLAGDLNGEGLALLLEPLIELHNGPAQSAPVPFEHWRGRLALELGYRFQVGEDSGFAVALRLEHESDHESASPRGRGLLLLAGSGPLSTAFEYINDVGLRLAWTKLLGGGALRAVLAARLHFATCTQDDPSCQDVSLGGVTVEPSFDAVYDSEAAAADVDLALTAALHASITPETARTHLERRIQLLVGLRVPTKHRGTFFFQGALHVGSEIGNLRKTSSIAPGGFIGWIW